MSVSVQQNYIAQNRILDLQLKDVLSSFTVFLQIYVNI